MFLALVELTPRFGAITQGKSIDRLLCFQPNVAKASTLQTRSVTASQLNTESPAKMQQNGHYDTVNHLQQQQQQQQPVNSE